MADIIEPRAQSRARGALARIGTAWPFGWPEVIAAAGVVLLAYGCSFIHPALPWVVTGILLVIYAVAVALPDRTGGNS